MADDPMPASPPAGSAPQPIPPPPLTVKAQYVKDLSFENPRAPQNLMQQIAPEIQISINVNLQRLAETDYEVALTVTAEAKQGGEPLFTVELVYAGVLSIGPMPQEHMRPMLLIEGPRLLFPFARNIVAEVVRDGGFPPLYLQPVDFVELYRREIASQQQVRPATAPSTTTPQ
jgi:preprotein translocase subunit SecB